MDKLLFQAVKADDLQAVQKILTMGQCDLNKPDHEGCTVLDVAIMSLLNTKKHDDLKLLRVLLSAGAELVSKGLVYSTMGLLKLTNMDLLKEVVTVVSENTSSYYIKGLLLQIMVQQGLEQLVAVLLKSGIDLDAFWDDQFDIRDLDFCTSSTNVYTKLRIVPPEIARVFIQAANNNETLSRICKDIIEYPAEVEENTVGDLVKELALAGHELTMHEAQILRKRCAYSVDWCLHFQKTPKTPKQLMRIYVRSQMEHNVLHGLHVLQQPLPEMTRNFILLQNEESGEEFEA